jgi:hypothetical protein
MRAVNTLPNPLPMGMKQVRPARRPCPFFVLAGVGFEPTTSGLWDEGNPFQTFHWVLRHPAYPRLTVHRVSLVQPAPLRPMAFLRFLLRHSMIIRVRGACLSQSRDLETDEGLIAFFKGVARDRRTHKR